MDTFFRCRNSALCCPTSSSALSSAQLGGVADICARRMVLRECVLGFVRVAAVLVVVRG